MKLSKNRVRYFFLIFATVIFLLPHSVDAQKKKKKNKKSNTEIVAKTPKKAPKKTIKSLTKSSKKIEGLFTIYQDTITGALQMVVSEDQLNKEYIHFAQIADGENGGVMMNEFPEAYLQANRRSRDNSDSVMAVNGSEYLELIATTGVEESDFPKIQAVHQHRIWKEIGQNYGQDASAAAIASLTKSDPGFNIEGASWTNNLSWVKGYENILEPMYQLSAQFHQYFDQKLVQNHPHQ